MKIDKNKFEMFKETKHYIVYTEKKPVSENDQTIIILDKIAGKLFSVNMTDKLFKLFFKPEEYKKIYMNQNTKQRGK